MYIYTLKVININYSDENIFYFRDLNNVRDFIYNEFTNDNPRMMSKYLYEGNLNHYYINKFKLN